MINYRINILKKQRIWEIDFTRGCCIILLAINYIIYYFYLYGNIYELNNTINDVVFVKLTELCTFIHVDFLARDIIRIVVLIFFFIVSGIASTLSKSNLKNCLGVFLFALIMVCVEYAINKITYYSLLPSYGIFFSYGFAKLLYIILEKFKGKYFYIICSTLCVIFFVLSIVALDFPSSPLQWFSISSKLGIHFDNFALFPILLFYTLGTMIGKNSYSKKCTMFPKSILQKARIILFCGKHSIIIYILSFTVMQLPFLALLILNN